MIKILLNFLIVVILGIIQVSFLTTWPIPIRSLNLILSLVIFLTIVVNYQKGLWWALAGGLFLELYANGIFGVLTLSLILTLVVINFLFNNFFTNRSFYSLLILGFFGTVVYHLISLGFQSLAIIFGFNITDFSFDFWSLFFWQPILNLIILTVVFFTYYSFTGRLKNIFLFSPDLYEIKDEH